MHNLKRTIEKNIHKHIFKNKVIIIYGARQTGKTTLIQKIQKKYNSYKSLYFNCDDLDIRQQLSNSTSTNLGQLIGNSKLIFIDEAQRVENIGVTLKILIDNYPKTQLVVTGSSSFDLANKINEPLTGRKYEFHLYPFSLEELGQIYSDLEIKRILENRILFGMYPDIVNNPDEARENLKNITKSYLYKDIFQYQGIRNPEILEKLLQALALQIGQEVSYGELANLINVNKKTINSYIQILEQAFIIFRLRPLHRNIRTELRKLRKIYFYDTGIRNAIINNLNPINLRNDVGQLWENFMLSERMKYNSNHNIYKNIYFWRTHHQQEIDYLEEEGGKFDGFEFKWKSKKYYPPKVFLDTYSNSSVNLISQDNFLKFIPCSFSKTDF